MRRCGAGQGLQGSGREVGGHGSWVDTASPDRMYLPISSQHRRPLPPFHLITPTSKAYKQYRIPHTCTRYRAA